MGDESIFFTRFQHDLPNLFDNNQGSYAVDNSTYVTLSPSIPYKEKLGVNGIRGLKIVIKNQVLNIRETIIKTIRSWLSVNYESSMLTTMIL